MGEVRIELINLKDVNRDIHTAKFQAHGRPACPLNTVASFLQFQPPDDNDHVAPIIARPLARTHDADNYSRTHV